MSVEPIPPEELDEIHTSYDKNSKLLSAIYMNIVQWREHQLQMYSDNANRYFKNLVANIEDVLPLHLLTPQSPPSIKYRKQQANWRGTPPAPEFQIEASPVAVIQNWNNNNNTKKRNNNENGNLGRRLREKAVQKTKRKRLNRNRNRTIRQIEPPASANMDSNSNASGRPDTLAYNGSNNK